MLSTGFVQAGMVVLLTRRHFYFALAIETNRDNRDKSMWQQNEKFLLVQSEKFLLTAGKITGWKRKLYC